MTNQSTRRTVGEQLAPLELSTLSHGTLSLPKTGLTHLQFRRFSGCPICNLHLRQFARRYEDLRRCNVEVVTFFHSPREAMYPHRDELPFPVVPDPEQVFYRTFGVEHSVHAMLSPNAAWAMLKGLATASVNPLTGGPNPNGLPAEFLLDENGVILALKYGDHANDQWSVDDVLGLANGYYGA